MIKKKQRLSNSSYPIPVKTTKFPISPQVTKKYDKAYDLIKEIFDDNKKR